MLPLNGGIVTLYIIFQHPVAIRKLQYHLIFSLYATFNKDFCVYYKLITLHVKRCIQTEY
jgi:hypothetical protein